MNIYDVIKKPILTEKSETLRNQKVYLFEIDVRANKKMVKEAVNKIYKVVPLKVNVCYSPEKEKRARFSMGRISKKKRAYVYLSKKDTIEIFEGV